MNKQPKPFDLEAAKNGAEILFDGGPATFIAHLPDNVLAHRVVVSYSGRVYAFTEGGCCIENQKPRLTMAPRTVKTMGYRAYYFTSMKHIYKAIVYESQTHTTTTVEKNPDFLGWIHTEWQYDEVEL